MSIPCDPLPARDLGEVFSQLAEDWPRLRGTRLFLTGGTGFFGTWLVETLLDANRRLQLDVQLVLLTRDPARWASRFPHLANDPAVETVAGDVRTISQETHPVLEGKFDYIIHAAFDSGKTPGTNSPWTVLETILTGTRRVLDLAERNGVRKLLFISSGAVYGKLPVTISHVDEDYRGGPDPTLPGSAYGEGKRAAELLSITHADAHRYECVIARSFAFVGPHLPLDAHFAVGNFLRDIMDGQEIVVAGDGTPLRSYLYAGDLAVWLWTILFRGRSGRAYNVGSPESISIADLARTVAQLRQPAASVTVKKTALADQIPERYVPDVTRARQELGLNVTIPLREALQRTIEWKKRDETTDINR